MFRISPDKISREAKKVPNSVSASSRTKPITVSQPSVITKKDMNSNLNGLSSTGVDEGYRRVEDLQLGVKSYQRKLNLIKPDSYRSDLKRKEAYTTYSNRWGFIYQNKDERNRLMRIDELHKFSDGTLTDVRTALDDRLKGIQMQYLPQSI
nr:hypothetical protein [Tanacetum cinerariifolium]